MATTQQIYTMLENQSLWQTIALCHQSLDDAGIAHALMGGVAVCLHGYQRNTVDVDLLIRPAEAPRVHETLERLDFVWFEREAEFRSPSGSVQFLLAGDRAGAGSEIVLPDPGDPHSTTVLEELPVLTLARLLESKIACGMGNLRRTHKDFADVVELIVCNQLDSSFARFLHRSLRTTFRKLVRASRGER